MSAKPRRLTGDPERLDRLSVVREGTVVLLFAPDEPPSLHRPKSFLRPPFLPWLRPVTALVLNTASTTLRVRINQLTSLDRLRLRDIQVDVGIRIDDQEEQQLIDLANDHGTGIEHYLLERVRLEVTAELGAVVTMTTVDELDPEQLTRLLDARLRVRGLAGGLLQRTSVDVTYAALDQRAASGPTPRNPIG